MLLFRDTQTQRPKAKLYLKQTPNSKKDNDLLTDELFKFDSQLKVSTHNSYRIQSESNKTIETSKVTKNEPKLFNQFFLQKKQQQKEDLKQTEPVEPLIDYNTSNKENDIKDETKTDIMNLPNNNIKRSKALTPISSINKSKRNNNPFAYDTKNGYTIDQNKPKVNQDRVITLSSILHISKFNCFAVLDGHGQNGHFIAELASQYISNYFTDSLKYYVSRNDFNNGRLTSLREVVNESDIYNKLSNKNYSLIKTCIKETQSKINESEYEIDFSGSTCCCVLQMDHHLICFNIGDSRAILIKSNKQIVQLSTDHKPSIPKEKKRIEENGGEVKKMNPLIDPFRVWVKDKCYPGIAMSRSLGDKIAKTIGVSCEPDIIDYTIDDYTDQYMIIATDGLWDHISNEQAEKIVTPCYMKNDSKLAVKLLIEASSSEYIKHNENVDDTSIIVVFFPLSLTSSS